MPDPSVASRASGAGSPEAKTGLFPLDLSGLLTRWPVPEDVVIITSAVVAGAGTGLGAVGFIWLLE